MRKLEVADAHVGLLAKLLAKIEFFSPLTIGQIEHIIPYVMLQSFDAGETVFKQGQRGDAFYIVHQGHVRVSHKKSLLSLSCELARLGPGEFFGETALISDAPRNATVGAVEPTQLFGLLASDFATVLANNPKAASEMKRIAERRGFDISHQ